MKSRLAAAYGLLSAACASTPAAPPPASPPMVSVFTVAHQDDWQLFMNPAAYRAMDEAHEKAVFIHVTAGDAGRGVSGEPVPYYLAREEGALRAVRFMANAADSTRGRGIAMESGKVDIAGHPVMRFAYANAVVYFLRLPDGNIVNGTVFTPHPQAIDKLRSAAVDAVETIDRSTRYVGWDDLVSTLAAIVERERVEGSGLTLHLAETNEALNPRDHPDHRATALAVEEVATRFPCAATHRHDEYATRDRPQNVKGEDYMIDVGTWAATASGLSDNLAGATWESEHNTWIGRSYSRAKPPSGVCAEARVS